MASTGVSAWSKVAGPFNTTMAIPERCTDRRRQSSHADWTFEIFRDIFMLFHDIFMLFHEIYIYIYYII